MDPKEAARIAKMIGVNGDTVQEKAAIVRVSIGSINPSEEQRVICTCGFDGKIEDCDMRRYRSDPESWGVRSGRAGWQWICPKCGEIVWRYYNVIS